jgi:hypothetical protein
MQFVWRKKHHVDEPKFNVTTLQLSIQDNYMQLFHENMRN